MERERVVIELKQGELRVVQCPPSIDVVLLNHDRMDSTIIIESTEEEV